MSNDSIPSVEGHLEVPGGKVWYRRFGNKSDRAPLLVAHGGPGFPHNYLLPLADLANEREVYFWDQLGCGNSERPEDTSLWTVQRSVDEVDAVVQGLGLDSFHVFGNSWGGMLMQQYLLDGKATPLSASISNSLADMETFQSDTQKLVDELPAEMHSILEHCIETNNFETPEFEELMMYWFEQYICRMSPWPQDLVDAYEKQGFGIYNTMIGPSDFLTNGVLKDWTVLDRLSEVEIPTYFIAGVWDECSPEHMWQMHKQVKYSEFVLFRKSAHMPFHEERPHFIETMRRFLERNE